MYTAVYGCMRHRGRVRDRGRCIAVSRLYDTLYQQNLYRITAPRDTAPRAIQPPRTRLQRSDRTCTCWPCNDRTHTRWQRSDRTVSYASTTQHCYFLFQVSRCASAVPSPLFYLVIQIHSTLYAHRERSARCLGSAAFDQLSCDENARFAAKLAQIFFAGLCPALSRSGA